MGLLDGLISNVLGAVTGGGAQQSNNPPGSNNPLGSLLNGLANSFGGGQAGSSAAGGVAAGSLLAAAMALMQQQGGLSALLEKFRQGGLGQHVDSWVGKGPNLPVSADQLHQVLGSGALNSIAAKLGIPAQQAGTSMAQLLPELVNQLTPGGQLPANHGSLLDDGLKTLQGLGH